MICFYVYNYLKSVLFLSQEENPIPWSCTRYVINVDNIYAKFKFILSEYLSEFKRHSSIILSKSSYILSNKTGYYSAVHIYILILDDLNNGIMNFYYKIF